MAQSQWNLPHDSQLLPSKEDKLRKLLEDGAPEKQLLRMAEKVAAARIKQLRIRRRQLVPTGNQELEDRYAEFDAKIDAIRQGGPEVILEEFRRRKP